MSHGQGQRQLGGMYTPPTGGMASRIVGRDKVFSKER